MDYLFGSKLRTQVLVAVAALGESYPSELAALFDVNLFAVQRVVASLESAGVLASRKRGTVRLVSLEPRFHAYDALYALLLEMSNEPLMLRRLAQIRRRPRAVGKSL